MRIRAAIGFTRWGCVRRGVCFWHRRTEASIFGASFRMNGSGDDGLCSMLSCPDLVIGALVSGPRTSLSQGSDRCLSLAYAFYALVGFRGSRVRGFDYRIFCFFSRVFLLGEKYVSALG